MNKKACEDDIRDQLQAYYGNEILDGEFECGNGSSSRDTHFVGDFEWGNLGKDEQGTAVGTNEDDRNNLFETEYDDFDEADMDGRFSELIRTKSLKELLMFYNNLSIRITRDEHKLQRLIYNNYSKLKYLSKFFKSISNEITTSALLEHLNSSFDAKKENESISDGDIGILSITDLYESKAKQLFEILEVLKGNVFNNENSKKLSEYLIYHNFVSIVVQLKRIDVILDDFYTKEDYKNVILLYNKWCQSLELLSNNSDKFKIIYSESTKTFNKTVNLVKDLLTVKSTGEVEDCVTNVIKVYNSLFDVKHYFKNEFVNNINSYIQSKTDELLVTQLNNLDDINETNQFIIFRNACMHISSKIFCPLKYIIRELINTDGSDDIQNNNLEEILKYFFDNSGSKLINLFTHLLVYKKIDLDINPGFEDILEGVRYLRESVEDLNEILTNRSNSSYEEVVNDNNSNLREEFQKIYQEWIKSILNNLFDISNINTKIGDIWDNLFDQVLYTGKVEINGSLANIFIKFNENVLSFNFNNHLFKFISKYCKLNLIDYDTCENLVRRNIKDYFQILLSKSSLQIKNEFFLKLNDKYTSCVKNYDKIKEIIHVELGSFNRDENGIGKHFDDFRDNCLGNKLAIVDYLTKMKYFLLVILTMRYLRRHTLISSISVLYKCFYDKDFAENVDMNSISNKDIYYLITGNNKVNVNATDNSENDIYINNRVKSTVLISELKEDVSVQIIDMIYKRLELLFMYVFVIWNVNVIIKEAMESTENYIGFDEFIDFINEKVSLLTAEVCELDREQCSTSFKNTSIKDFQFPVQEYEKSVIYGKWCKNYRILSEFDLNNDKLLKNDLSFWITQVVNGVLIEILTILNEKSVFTQVYGSVKVLIETRKNDKMGNDLIAATPRRMSDGKESSVRSLTRFWENTNKGCIRYNKEFNITYALFCEIYNTLLGRIEPKTDHKVL